MTVMLLGRWLSPFLIFAVFFIPAFPAWADTSSTQALSTSAILELQAEREAFQYQELIPARAGSFVFSPGKPPRIIWRDLEEVQRLGCTEPLRVRWFDADLNEVTTPTTPGRWGAWIEGTAPNGTPLRRSMTFFCRPPMFLWYTPPKFTEPFPSTGAPVDPAVWEEHQEEVCATAHELLTRSLNDSEAGAILLAGLYEAEKLGRACSSLETAVARNEEYHLALKLKVLGLADKVRPPAPPRKRSTPVPVLREGSEEEAGMRPGARKRLDELCRAWGEGTTEPFTTLVARRGVVVLHEAYGQNAEGQTVGRDYRCDIASITKTVSAVLLNRFLDQGLLDLDAPLSTVFPDYPEDSPHVPTVRQCMHHMSGVAGHGTFGGVRHPHLESILLNGIDVLYPGKHHVYSGLNMDWVGKAMEMVSGKTVRRLMRENLWEPLGAGDVPMGDLGAGLRPTAWELGLIGQLLANRGSYGDRELFSPETFEKMLPEELGDRYPEAGVREEYGLAIGWRPELKLGADPASTSTADMIFGPRTLGHGSITQCVLRVDLERELVVVQIRRGGGWNYGEWAPRFFQAIVDEVDGANEADGERKKLNAKGK